jgi:hypothetical protein
MMRVPRQKGRKHMVAENALDEAVMKYVRKGYRLSAQTDHSAQLLKPKQFSLFWFFVGFGIFYLPYYLAKGDKTVYLTIEGDRVKAR